MTFEVLDTEDWKAKDFIRYILGKLADKGVAYTPHYPMDIILISKLISRIRHENKTMYYIKKKIDEAFEGMDIKSINSLQFIPSIFSIKSNGYRKAQTPHVKTLPPVRISIDLRRRLEGLK